MSARKRPPYAEPLELDGDMNRTDLVFLLRRLQFAGERDVQLVAVDRDIRDFLVRTLETK